MPKQEEKRMAVAMRRKGKTYAEILDVVHVAKSTLSIWLREVKLAQPQKQRITSLRIDAQKRGAQARRDMRQRDVDVAIKQGRNDVGVLSARELWLVGTALHWAEGAKQNRRSPSMGIVFGNMDHKMILVFLKWLSSLGVKDKDIVVTLYIHTTRFDEADVFVAWWSKSLGIPKSRIQGVYKKSGNISTNRTNTGDLYHGIIRIKVNRSTALNRQVQGWFDGLYSAVQE